MHKEIIRPLGVLLLFIGLSSCYYIQEHYIDTKPVLLRTNIVGIAGPPAAEPYVEIIYRKADGNTGKNITESIMVSPPYTFESVFYVLFDSIDILERTGWMSKGWAGYALFMQHDYGENGAEYFRIINHSEDKTVEFFLAGAQELTPTEYDAQEIEVIPSVYYRKAPIVYLLYPERKYEINMRCATNKPNVYETFYFEGNRCGELELNSAWSVDDVMKLYRAEYNLSPDTILYVDLFGDHKGRMSDALRTAHHRLTNRHFYGLIPAGQHFAGDENFWLPATPYIFYENLSRRK